MARPAFLDRDAELAFLEGEWRRPGAQMVVLWGKRRVGKTSLVREFVRTRPHVYFLAETTGEGELCRRLAVSLSTFFGDSFVAGSGMGWFDLLDYARSKDRRMVLVIDEFPYLLAANPAAASIFQRAWDESLVHGRILLILLGSSVGMMEREVLGERSPLFGRRTGQYLVRPLSFAAASGFRPHRAFSDRLTHYGIAGGIPAYWKAFDRRASAQENLRAHVLAKGSYLYDEVPFLLREELREPRLYFSLLQAIAQGKRRLSEIANAVGLAANAAHKYLSVLADLQAVEREVPATEAQPAKSRLGLWRIVEPFVAFWFRYVFPHRAALEMERADEVMAAIRGDLDAYLGGMYERVAAELLWSWRELLFPFTRVGRAWGPQAEADVVALEPASGAALFGEVKWSRRPVGTDVYARLRVAAGTLSAAGAIHGERFCLFSRSGFTPGMRRVAREEGVWLVHGDRVVEPAGME